MLSDVPCLCSHATHAHHARCHACAAQSINVVLGSMCVPKDEGGPLHRGMALLEVVIFKDISGTRGFLPSLLSSAYVYTC